MSESPRLLDYLGHMQQAALEACTFVEGLAKEDFLADRRTQQAVVMSSNGDDSSAGLSRLHPVSP